MVVIRRMKPKRNNRLLYFGSIIVVIIVVFLSVGFSAFLNQLFIDDIILNYLELFEIEEKYVQLAIFDIKSILGDNFVEQIGKNMTFIDKIIRLAISYSEKNDF